MKKLFETDDPVVGGLYQGRRPERHKNFVLIVSVDEDLFMPSDVCFQDIGRENERECWVLTYISKEQISSSRIGKKSWAMVAKRVK